MASKKVSSKTYKSKSVPGSGKSATPAKKQGVTWRAMRASSAERASARKERTVRGATEGPKRSVPRSTAKSQAAAARKRRAR